MENGTWLKYARHSNAMASRLEAGLRPLKEVKIAYPVESNAVFAKIPDKVIKGLHERGWHFYTNIGGWEESRLMCSWDTTPEDVDGFVADMKELLSART